MKNLIKRLLSLVVLCCLCVRLPAQELQDITSEQDKLVFDFVTNMKLNLNLSNEKLKSLENQMNERSENYEMCLNEMTTYYEVQILSLQDTLNSQKREIAVFKGCTITLSVCVVILATACLWSNFHGKN